MPSEASTADAQQDLHRRVGELERALAEARDRETATSDVLKVISRSTFDLKNVLKTLVNSAASLCQAESVQIFLRDGKLYRLEADNGFSPEYQEYVRCNPIAPGRGTLVARTALEVATVHIPDVLADSEYTWREGQRLGRFRAMLGVPLLRDGSCIGVMAMTRSIPQPFTSNQIELITTFADQAVIAIENTRLFEAEQASKRDLTEALEQQTATADVLKVISRSALDLQRVLDALVESAARLCNAYDAAIFQVFGKDLRLVAHHGQIPTAGPVGQHTFPLVRGRVAARAVIDRRTIHVADIQAEADEYPEGQKNALQTGWRTGLCVPLVHAGKPIGVILIRRAEVRPFTERQIELVNTFADQAVIAIENTRLFEEVQERNLALAEANKQLTETLEQQTATSRILRVISGSPTDVRPVFETVAECSVTLCHADRAIIYRSEGEFLRLGATYNVSAELKDFIERNPIPPGRQSASGRAALERQTVHIPDLQRDAEYTYGWRRDVDPIRTALAVPMLKGDMLLGVIFIYKFEVRPFTDKQISLVETFADQAAIAISNVGLFEEVQARTGELTETLKRQTATSEILSVISNSPTDVQPVFDAIAESSVRLCGADYCSVNRLEGETIHLAALHGLTTSLTARRLFPHPLTRDLIAGAAMLDREAVHLQDLQNDARFRASQAIARTTGYRTALSVPMLREDRAVGAIVVFRQRQRSFTESEIALLRTFADQAVIAIENTRLFEEVQARNRDLTALGEVGRAVSSTLDLRVVLKTIVDRAVELSSTDGGSFFYYRGGRFELGETTGLDEEDIARFRNLDIAAEQTGLGEAIARRQPLQVPDIFQRPNNPLRDAAIEAGFRAGLIVPLLGSESPLGALVLQRRKPGEFTPAVVSLMQAFADQSAIALENARLFQEIAQKGRELEIASQHKSQFVANMSHELRTPLAAILGYAELMQEGFYEPLGQKSLDALTRIRSNGNHLLGLINTVLDIAKIESGQFTLNMAEYTIESVVETVRSATESLAQNKKLLLTTEVTKPLPPGLGDEQRLTQVLLNLVGNAIKFTDKGEVRVTANSVNGHFAVSVTDTGPGIPEEHRARIFEQFHQVDSSNTKAKGGTGLGLAIAKQIIEMHGGRIWVESTLGKGSTFQMELPTRAEFRKMAS